MSCKALLANSFPSVADAAAPVLATIWEVDHVVPDSSATPRCDGLDGDFPPGRGSRGAGSAPSRGYRFRKPGLGPGRAAFGGPAGRPDRAPRALSRLPAQPGFRGVHLPARGRGGRAVAAA